LENSKKRQYRKKRLNTYKSVRLEMVEVYKLFKQKKMTENYFKACIYGLKAIADIIEKEVNIERLEGLEEELKKLKEVI
jgi:hypothetical protein